MVGETGEWGREEKGRKAKNNQQKLQDPGGPRIGFWVQQQDQARASVSNRK